MTKSISRRDFLKGSLAATGLTVAVSVTPLGYKLLNASGHKGKMLSSFKPNVWFEITPDNIVTITIGASEMGQGVKTALPMIVADELDADWGLVKVVQGPANLAFKNPVLPVQMTVASASCRGFYKPLRAVGAAGRAMLIQAAASTWDVPVGECKADNGYIKHTKSGKSLTYGQLCLKAATLPAPKDPPLKNESEFRYMGKPMPRIDIPDKVNAKPVFAQDVDLPDLHYAVLARPPAYGAKHEFFDKTAAMSVAGVKAVVPTPNGIAVCATTLDAAWKGRDALNVKWGKGSHPQMDTAYVEKSLMDDLNKPLSTAAKKGDPGLALEKAAAKLEATYYVPAVAHVTMEPQTTTAYVQKDRCDVWAPTQGQTVAHMLAAKISGAPKENTHIHTMMLGCGFGRRSRPEQVVESVIASKALGKPVKVMYTREEDIQTDFFRAPAAHRVKAGLDSNGSVTAWAHQVSSTSILKFLVPNFKGPVDVYCLWGLAQSPKAPHRNNNFMYDGIPNFSVDMIINELPITAAPWRAVQNGPNAFVIQSFMDELAHKAGKDPVEFRLAALGDNRRAKRVLQQVAKKAGWGKPVPRGMGRGIAQHQCFGTYIAAVADVSVNKTSGVVKVHRIVIGADCGPVINPGPLVAQLEGGVTMALSTALKEEVKFANGGVSSGNFEDYPILTMSEVPDIEVHIVKSNDEIGGIGELGVPATAPAVANAVFNATGVRVRRIPMTPENVLAAMKG
ncbi:molybdopterin cofactor-binding domain-containing protein [Thermodesulfobacteriota bacterium]